MQRTRDIRARKILVELLDDPDLSPQARNSLEAARKQLDKAILRLNRTNALMTIADAIDLISGEQDSQAKAG
jgi:hypothetical protein